MRRALVLGSGLAGLSCANILVRQGWNVEVWGAVSAASPILVLNDTTCGILQDIWQGDNLSQNSFHTNERVVYWGTDGTPSVVAQPSKVIRGDQLITRLLDRLSKLHHDQVCIDESPGSMSRLMEPRSFHQMAQRFDWIIDASGRASHFARKLGAVRHSAGHRHATSVEVRLVSPTERDACCIEMVPDGWVFLAPLGKEYALLQIMTAAAPENPLTMLTALLEETRFIKTKVAGTLGPASVFQASPQMSNPLCGAGWITVGDAAVSFDPVCGDGSGYALRGAILAAGIIDGIASGLLMSDCLRHYTLRLRKTFFSHLKECLGYYSMGMLSSDWKDELKRMKQAFSHDKHFSGSAEHLLYALNGFKLVPLEVNQ